MTQFGVDLSSFQGQVTEAEIEALKYVGVTFAYVKATQGTDYINPDAPQQVHALRNAGIRVGLYHFWDPTKTAMNQAQYFFVAASGLGGSDLPVALDLEVGDPLGWSNLASQVVAFAMQIENEPHVIRNNQTVFYVNGTFYDNLPGFPWGRGIWFADPGVPAPTKPCLIWQKAPAPLGPFTSIDPDEFVGSEAQWQVFIGGSPSVTTPPTVRPSPTPPQVPPTVPSTPAPKEFDLSTLANLEAYSTGNLVKSLQSLLKEKFGQVLTVTGSFDGATVEGVENVQRFFKMPVTGKVGQAEWAVLLEL